MPDFVVALLIALGVIDPVATAESDTIVWGT